MTGPEKLVKFLDEAEKAVMDEMVKLVLDDAPKNRFSVNTGKILAIRDIRDNLRLIFEG